MSTVAGELIISIPTFVPREVAHRPAGANCEYSTFVQNEAHALPDTENDAGIRAMNRRFGLTIRMASPRLRASSNSGPNAAYHLRERDAVVTRHLRQCFTAPGTALTSACNGGMRLKQQLITACCETSTQNHTSLCNIRPACHTFMT